MIILEDKKNCCGCGACVQVCPKHCVSLFEDDEGFLYPQTQVDICVNCHLCEQVCPVLETRKGTAPLHTYAVKNRNDDIRLKSSSGGVFTLLAEKVLQQSGIVFGARFDENWEVVHDYTDSVEGLSLFRGSKYVQSRMGNSYVKAKSFLKEGRMVLFSGTPCQIAGLKIFLKKEYANLLTVDFLCHGVPAPKVWRMYLAETRLRYAVDNRTQIREVNFRLKKTGWKNYSIGIDFYSGLYVSVFRKDLFMQAFLADLILRPSCYDCSFKRGKSGSDITIGDYWNVDAILPTFDDDKGVSLVLVNTEKGEIEKNTFLHYADCLETGLKPEAMCYNGGFKEKIEIPLNRKLFFSDLEHSIYVSPLMEKYCKQASGFFFRIKCLARKIRNKI